jgi:hypothetical protein
VLIGLYTRVTEGFFSSLERDTGYFDCDIWCDNLVPGMVLRKKNCALLMFFSPVLQTPE